MAAKVLGLRWKEAGSKAPSGTEIKNEPLAQALQKLERTLFLYSGAHTVEFKKEDWEKFKVTDLDGKSYVKAGDRYFTPAAEDEKIEQIEWVDKIVEVPVTYSQSY